MTHTTVDGGETENSGSENAVTHTIDITALDAAGLENYDPSAETAINRVSSVIVAGQADPTYFVTYDEAAGGLQTVAIADGTDAANDAAVGEVTLRVTGD